MRTFRFGVRQKLAVWLGLLLVPVIVGCAVALHSVHARLAERVGIDLMNTQRLEALRISESLGSYRREVELLAGGDHVVSFVSGLHRRANGGGEPVGPIGGLDGFAVIDPRAAAPLQALVERLGAKAGSVGSEAVEFMLTDATGRSLGRTSGFSWQPYAADLFTRSVALRRTLFGNAFRIPSGEDRLGMVTPVLDGKGRSVGTLVTEMRLEPVVGLIVQHEGFGQTSEAHIAQPTPSGDAEFITLLRFERDAAFNVIVPRERNLPINRSLTSPQAQLLRSADYRGVDSILSIETLPEVGWGLVVKIDAEEAFQPIAEVLKILLLSAGVLMFLIVAWWLTFLRPLGRRLQRLAGAAQRVAGGDLETTISDRSADEIGDTARSIDTLARELVKDIRRRSRAERRLRHQARRDGLTGLYNRKRGNELIALLDDNVADVPHRAVLFLDLNGFKQINDTRGHAAGDGILVALAQRLLGVVGSHSTVIRWGGDEFVILATGADAERVEELMQRLEAMFAQPIALDCGEYRVACSIGLARAQGGDRATNDLLIEADGRMYENKRARCGFRAA